PVRALRGIWSGLEPPTTTTLPGSAYTRSATGFCATGQWVLSVMSVQPMNDGIGKKSVEPASLKKNDVARVAAAGVAGVAVGWLTYSRRISPPSSANSFWNAASGGASGVASGFASGVGFESMEPASIGLPVSS